MPANELSNLTNVLVSRYVINNAGVLNTKQIKIPTKFYYKSSDFNNFNEYRQTFQKTGGNFAEGFFFIDTQNIPLYSSSNNEVIGSVTFQDFCIKSTPGHNTGLVEEKTIFNLNDGSIITEFCFKSDTAYYPEGTVELNLRITGGTGAYMNLQGYYANVKINTDGNRVISFRHN